MITRALSFLTDILVFLFTYCFIFVSVIILFFDRNTDYDRFLTSFYILMGIAGYFYFILPLLWRGQTLGKKLFKITLQSNKGITNIIRIHVKYILLRIFPLVSILLVFYAEPLFIKILWGLFASYLFVDLVFLSMYEITLSDKILQLDMNVY